MKQQLLAIHSVPRSGSSWLGSIINSSPSVTYKYQPLFSYAFKGALNENSSETEINTFFKNISICNDNFLNQNINIEKGYHPKFKKKTIAISLLIKKYDIIIF